MSVERVVLVTRQTDLEALVERFQTRSQAQFYLEQAGLDFASVAGRHERYRGALEQVRAALPATLPAQVLERRDLPRQHFGPDDIVIALGPDGLVANIARYLSGQPLIAVNPDPQSIDGVLLPVSIAAFAGVLRRTLAGAACCAQVTMAEAQTSDGQRLRAVNDIFVGARSHVSVRYRIETADGAEEHSSSGLIASTGVGSTGWLRSVYAGAIGIARALDPGLGLEPPAPLAWDAGCLVFNVREPWPSGHTAAGLVSGRLDGGTSLRLVSRMPGGGVVFADGMEEDFLEFNSGTSVTIGVAAQSLSLVTA